MAGKSSSSRTRNIHNYHKRNDTFIGNFGISPSSPLIFFFPSWPAAASHFLLGLKSAKIAIHRVIKASLQETLPADTLL